MLEWLVRDMPDWLYLHMSSGRKGVFLFCFATAAELILFFVWVIAWSWWAECSDVSKSEDFIKKSKSKPMKGITNMEDKTSQGAGKEVCLFSLVSIRVTWLGGLSAVHAVCKFRCLFAFSVGSVCFSGWLAMLVACSQLDKAWYYMFMSALLFSCVIALFSGLLMWAFSETKGWKDSKRELYRLAKKSLFNKWCNW